LSTHGAVIISNAGHTAHIADLEQALASNRQIGVAIGILMALHKLSQDQAFDALRVASQHTHRKLRDIADDVVHTGTIQLPT
jgi:AmiR/NasT family two-component response regulator